MHKRRCEWCAFESVHRSSLSRHRTRCTHRPQPLERAGCYTTARRCSCGYLCADRSNWSKHVRRCGHATTPLRECVQQLAEQLVEKDRQIHSLMQLTAAGTNAAAITTHHNTLNVLIVAPVFGHEAPPSDEHVARLLDDPRTSIREYVRLRHLRPGVQNIRMTNKRSKFAEVVREVSGQKQWAHEDLRGVLEDVVDVSRSDLRGVAEGVEHNRWLRFDACVDRSVEKLREQHRAVEMLLMDR